MRNVNPATGGARECTRGKRAAGAARVARAADGERPAAPKWRRLYPRLANVQRIRERKTPAQRYATAYDGRGEKYGNGYGKPAAANKVTAARATRAANKVTERERGARDGWTDTDATGRGFPVVNR